MFSITVNVVVILVEVRCRYFNLLRHSGLFHILSKYFGQIYRDFALVGNC